MSTKKLYRNEKDKVLAGVCSGLAAYLSVDANIVRLIYILLTAFTGFFPGIIAYIIAVVVIPQEPN